MLGGHGLATKGVGTSYEEVYNIPLVIRAPHLAAGREDGEHVVIALNFTPVPREGYRVGVPGEGPYLELLSSDAEVYGGSGVGNGQGPLVTEPVHWMNRPQSVVVTLPPLGGIVLKPVPARALATPTAAPVAPESEDSEGPDRGPGADDATSVNS
jgi:hypothetical protein